MLQVLQDHKVFQAPYLLPELKGLKVLKVLKVLQDHKELKGLREG